MTKNKGILFRFVIGFICGAIAVSVYFLVR